jgi:pimeloyl-ACP methyl ester carboxylesterase
MIDFLLFGERQKNVRWFMDQYTQARAMYPGASMNFVGHSNGTYLLASALTRYKACTFRNVVFVGSVVPRDFKWDEMVPNKVEAIRNYVASSDWIVGVLPRFFEYFPSPDVGSAGFRGFVSREGKRHEVTFVKGGHSAALDPSNFRAIATFVLDGRPDNPPHRLAVNEQSSTVKLCSKFAFAIWGLGILLIGLGFWVTVRLSIPHNVFLGIVLYLAILLSIFKNV